MAEATTRELVDTCVHCGFCLPACPTYSLWGDESDSPRGRIHLMSLLDGGELEMGPVGCAPLRPLPGLHGLRPGLPERRPLRPPDRAHPRRAAGAGPARRMGAASSTPPSSLPSPGRGSCGRSPGRSRSASARSRSPRACGRPTCAPARSRTTPAAGERRMTAALLEGCVQRALFGRVNVRGRRRWRGRLRGGRAARPGMLRRARPPRRPRATRRAGGRPRPSPRFAGHDRVVVTAAGCGSAMKGYGELLGTDEARRFAARVRDVTEVLAELGPRGRAAPLAADPRRLPGRVPPEPRPGRGRPAARDPERRSPASSLSRSRTPGCAAARPGSTTSSSPAPPASSASARRARSWPPSRTSSPPPTPAAPSSSRRRFAASAAATCASHPAELVAEAVSAAGRLRLLRRPEPEARVARLEGVLDHAEQLAAESVEVDLLPQPAREGPQRRLGVDRAA